MSEDEIEKWEAKAKSGLLRNDSILTNGLYGMRSSFMNSVAGLGDATMDSLAEIGITTSSTYSDGGKLVIDEDKLRSAIEKIQTKWHLCLHKQVLLQRMKMEKLLTRAE